MTQRKLDVAGALNVISATKIVGKLLGMDAQGEAPIYLMLTATKGSVQGVRMVADTIGVLRSPVVAVVLTSVQGAGATLAPFADRLEMYPSSSLVFVDLPYEGVSKPKKDDKDAAKKTDSEASDSAKKKSDTAAKKAPAPKAKVPTAEKKLLQKVRVQYLDRFWDDLAKRMDYKKKDLVKWIEEGGFVLSAEDALRRKVADAVVEEVSLKHLATRKVERKSVTTLKTVETP